MKTMLITPRWVAAPSAALAVVLFCIIWPPAASGYVLESPHVLELAARAMGRIPALEIQQKLLIYPDTPDTFPTVFDETVWIVAPRRFRSDIVSGRIKRTHLEVGDQSLTVIDGRIAVTRDLFDLYQQILRSRSRRALMTTLNALGVETAISSLGRIEDRVVFIIGARYPDESVSQLAVDKESFLPVRLLLAEKRIDEADHKVEIHYCNWQKIQDGLFPEQILFYLDTILKKESRVVQMRTNPKMATNLMDLEALKASTVVMETGTLEERRQNDVEAVQQKVEEFRKKFD